MSDSPGSSATAIECPVCSKSFSSSAIEGHVNRCIFLNTNAQANNSNNATTPVSESSGSTGPEAKRRMFGMFDQRSPGDIKKPKLEAKSKRSLNGWNGNKSTPEPAVIDVDVDDGSSDDEAPTKIARERNADPIIKHSLVNVKKVKTQ